MEDFSQWSDKSGNKAIDDPHERMLHRLRGILARTNSPNESEAATAAALLQKFLVEHNLSMADLEQRGASAPELKEGGYDLGKAAFKWKLNLAKGIAEFYYCAPLVNDYAKTVKFAGRPDNIEALTMLYGWVIDQIKAIAKEERRKHFDTTGEHIDPLRWQVAFGEGAVERLVDRMHELKARQTEDMSRDEFGNVTALALHHQSEVSDYLEKQYGYRVDGKETESERKWRLKREESKRRQAEMLAEKDALRVRCEDAGDMGPYYEKYPDEHPDEIAKKKAANDKWMADYLKREARNEKRRRGSYRPGPNVDWKKEEQAGTARASGRANADKVNLQPFIGSGSPERKKVSNG